MKKTQLLVIMLASVIGGLVAVFAYSAILDKKEKNIVSAVREPISMVSLKAGLDSSTDFTVGSRKNN